MFAPGLTGRTTAVIQSPSRKAYLKIIAQLISKCLWFFQESNQEPLACQAEFLCENKLRLS